MKVIPLTWLPEQEKWATSHDSGIGLEIQHTKEKETADANLPQKRKLRPPTRTRNNSDPKATVQDPRKRLRSDLNKKQQRKRHAPVATTRYSAQTSSSSFRLGCLPPNIRMRIDDEPLIAEGDEDDELLLTSKGWDWDPLTSCVLLPFFWQRLVRFLYIQESSTVNRLLRHEYSVKRRDTLNKSFVRYYDLKLRLRLHHSPLRHGSNSIYCQFSATNDS